MTEVAAPSRRVRKLLVGRPMRTGQLEESYPELAPLLATPCDFVIYHKNLPRSP